MPPTLRPRKQNPGAVPASALSSQTTSTVSSSAESRSTTPLKKRPARRPAHEKQTTGYEMSPSDEDQQPLLDLSATATEDGVEALSSVESRGGWAQRNQWIVLALASGACAAFNGAFAKLTTTELTTSFSLGIARLMGLESLERVIEVAVRCTFFGLNLAFNGVMWTLFTKALARGDSTTQVSIINTSANFIITALLGYAIFSEALPPLWWLGAGMLVAGNVIVGRKDEGLPKEEVQGEGESEVVIAGDDDTLISGRRLEDSPGQVSGRRAHPSLGKDEDEDVADLRM